MSLKALEAWLVANENKAVVGWVRREMTQVQHDLTTVRREPDHIRGLLREAREETETFRRNAGGALGLEAHEKTFRELAVAALQNKELTVALDEAQDEIAALRADLERSRLRGILWRRSFRR